MQDKIVAIRCQRIQYGSRLLKMKKQLLDHKQLLRDRNFHGTERIPIRKFQEMDWLLEEIQQTLSRFSQREISLSVVNGWMSGQERFLSGFCGLPGDLVPFWFPGTIHNTAFMYPGELRADLSFYTREEMLENVKKMITYITEDPARYQDLIFEEIPYIPLDALEKEIEQDDPFKRELLQELTELVLDFAGLGESCSIPIRELCGSPNRIITDMEELVRYVGWSNKSLCLSSCRSKEDWERYSSRFAVKRMDLFTRFPWTEADIAFSVDVPCRELFRVVPEEELWGRTLDKDAVLYADSYYIHGFMMRHVGFANALHKINWKPQERLFFLFDQSFDSAGAFGTARSAKQSRCCAGASAVRFEYPDAESFADFQKDIVLPFLDALPGLDRACMEDLQMRFDEALGNR